MNTEIDRLRIEQDFKVLLQDKDSENVRLRAEINRLRQALNLSQTAQTAHDKELQSLQQQLQAVNTLNKAHERQSVLSAANAATGSPRAETVRLQAELEGQMALVSRLEAELSSHQSSAAARISELQESFTVKIQGMRQSHQEQLAARERDASSREASFQEKISTLTLQLGGKMAQIAHLEDEIAELRRSSTSAEAALSKERQRVSQLETDIKVLGQRLTEQSKVSSEVAERLAEKVAVPALGTGRTSTGGPERSTGGNRESGGGIDQSGLKDMLTMMEGQLGRLSEMIRHKDTEIAALRKTVQSGCDERRELQQQLARANQQEQPTATAVATNFDSISQKGDLKPFRTVPQHKPKFR
ncbi:hypothetical protein CEUSTIGMA_g10463.t1 [Chlamydomonas eustigma]|uniref:Uncharacterized protein n=1 Tax=Chlamydomonas eustigma TaxID=1157962 RepID=A0A250XIY4_9CHLO|nr:hypothetical protein CEUSTIGMA_g10463.t1 [Chlamydomonas eustigma]|eukprot:GAX83037.1 hypothetical protein CEUSTIGMA_g10463.t1 [Chlamydomonas eustigma]